MKSELIWGVYQGATSDCLRIRAQCDPTPCSIGLVIESKYNCLPKIISKTYSLFPFLVRHVIRKRKDRISLFQCNLKDVFVGKNTQSFKSVSQIFANDKTVNITITINIVWIL